MKAEDIQYIYCCNKSNQYGGPQLMIALHIHYAIEIEYHIKEIVPFWGFHILRH